MKQASLLRQVLAILDEPLVRAGFERKAHSWIRRREPFVDVVELQLAKMADSREPTFALNLGVFSAVVHEATWGGSAPTRPKEEDCVLRTRLVQGLTSGSARRDRWWTLRSSDDAIGVEKEIGTLVRTEALPFFERNRTLADVASTLEAWAQQGGSVQPIDGIHLGALYGVMGDRRKARVALDAAVANGPAWKVRAAHVAERLDI